MELDIFEEALDALIESDAANYGDGESMERLHHLQARFDSFVTEATSAFEAGEEWAADGAKTAAIVDRHDVSCLTGRRQAPGPPRTHPAPPARGGPGLA